MGWQVEQNTGVNGQIIRTVWFKGYIYAMTERDGIWRRDGIGPWVKVFNGRGIGWYWEDDGALYCTGPGGGWQIHRSTDGLAWPMDIDLLVTFGAHAGGSWSPWGSMGGYGNYFHYASHDVGGPGRTYFYRRDLNGVWDMPFALHVGVEGNNVRGIIGFGGEVYWTNAANARYWDGAAWAIETTLDGQGGTYMSLIDHILYVETSTSHSYLGGFFWKTTPATNWTFLNMPVPDNTYSVWPLCQGADGESYTFTENGGAVADWQMRVYRRVGNYLALIHYEPLTVLSPGGRGGVCVDAAGDMYLGTRDAGTIQFYAFVPIHNQTPIGSGLPPQAMDCDADGDALYLGLYDNAGNPILVRVPLPLTATAMGSVMHNPGAGDSINVKCSEVGQQLAISGFFGAGEQVEVSLDAGLTWTDVDPGWANERAQPLEVGPEALNDLMVTLDALQDLYDTEDMGVAWTQEQAAIGYSPGAMRRKRNEVILGDDAANSIEYSPNRGQQLTDITGAFAGNVAALDVA